MGLLLALAFGCAPGVAVHGRLVGLPGRGAIEQGVCSMFPQHKADQLDSRAAGALADPEPEPDNKNRDED